MIRLKCNQYLTLLVGINEMMPAEGVSHGKTSAVRVDNLLYKINDLTDSPERRTSFRRHI